MIIDDTVFLLIGIICICLFVFMICVGISIIKISQDLKEFVDLQYKIYKEKNENSVSSESRPD